MRHRCKKAPCDLCVTVIASQISRAAVAIIGVLDLKSANVCGIDQ